MGNLCRGVLLLILLLSTTCGYSQQDTLSDSELDSLIDRVKVFLHEFTDVEALDHSLQVRSASKSAVKGRLEYYFNQSGIDFTTFSNLAIDEFWPRTVNRKMVYSIVNGKLDTVVFDNNESYSVNVRYTFLPNSDSTKYSVLFKGKVNDKLVQFLKQKNPTIDLQQAVYDYLKTQPLIYNKYDKPKEAKDDIISVLDLLYAKVYAITKDYAQQLLDLQDQINNANQTFPLASSGFHVQFYADQNQNYGFDGYEDGYQPWQDDYQTIIMEADNTPYKVAIKSMDDNAHDKVIAKLINVDSHAITAGKIRFIDSKQNEVTIESADSSTNTFVLNLPTISRKRDVFAYFDGNKPIGKLELRSFKKRTKRITLVPVCNGVSPTSAEIKSQLNAIYKQALIDWQIDLKPSFSTSTFYNQILSNPDVNGLAKYTNEMKQLRDEYLAQDTTLDRQSYLIFVIDGFSDQSIEGYMVRGRGMGFITRGAFNDLQNKTLAHELAHGTFGLNHTFDEIPKTTTNNLLDYTPGITNTKLTYKKQWKKIHSPLPTVSWLDADEEGEYSTDLAKTVKILQEIRCALYSGQTALDLPIVERLGHNYHNYVGALFEVGNNLYHDITLKFEADGSTNLPVSNIIELSEHEVKIGDLSIAFTCDKQVFYDFIHPTPETIRAELRYAVEGIPMNQSSFTVADWQIERIKNNTCALSLVLGDLGYDYQFKLIKAIAFHDQSVTLESEEDLILDIIQGINSEHSERFLDDLSNNPALLSLLMNDFNNATLIFEENNRDRLYALLISHWLNSTRHSNPDNYSYNTSISSTGSCDAEALIHFDSDNFFRNIVFDYTKLENQKVVLKSSSANNDIGANICLNYDFFQPVQLVNEEEQVVAYVPATIALGIIRDANTESMQTQLSLTADVLLTFSGIGNLTKLKHLSNMKKAGQIIMAGLEVGSSAADILLNYTKLCDDNISPAFCDNLRQYNFYLQMTMLGGQVLNAAGKLKVQSYYNNLSEEYIANRNQLKQNLTSNEIDELDGFFRWPGKLEYAWKEGWDADRVLSYPKGSRPPVADYLKQSYIDAHLAKFEEEGYASRVVLKRDYDKYGIGKPDEGKTEFVGLKSEIDEILTLPVDQMSERLGIPLDQLSGDILRVDFKISINCVAEIPTGNEFGVNDFWLPGGKLPDGDYESIIKTEGLTKDVDYFVIEI